jgi:hypothetical protein
MEMLAGEDETVSITCLDINTVRAGDKLVLNGNEWLVTSVRHELGLPGRMFLELAPEEVVRRRFYGGSF